MESPHKPQPSSQDFAERLRAAAAGDRAAFDALAAEHAERVRAVLRLKTGRKLQKRVDIEDLTQEVFLRAFRSIGSLKCEDAAAFWGWLRTIAEHVVLDEARRLRAREPGPGRREVSLDDRIGPGADEEGSRTLESLLEASGASPSRGVRREERFERLDRVLRSLPPDHAKVIYLARVKGLPMKEVARRMERSPEAASMLLFRALVKLKDAFGPTESLSLPERSLETTDGGASHVS